MVFLEMARIGWIPVGSEKSIEVYVRTNDPGKIPHFHVRKYNKNGPADWDVPVKYEEPSYFFHGKYKTGFQSKKIIKDLDEMLRQDNPRDPGRTYWQTAIVAWNNNNSDVELPFDLKQPEYTVLEVY